MKILHTADWHLGKNLEGQSRLFEQELFLNDFINIVEENKIDMVIIAGDIYDSFTPPARAERLFYDTLKRISKNGERLTIVISGNHDSPERLVAAGPLATDHGIIMVGTPQTVVEPGLYGKHRVKASGKGYFEIEINGEKAVVLAIPYPSEKRLNEVLYSDMEGDSEKLESYELRLKQLFEELAENYRSDTINLLVSHLFVLGSEEAGSERGIQLGGSYLIDSKIFPSKAQYIALGHIHKPQIVPGTEKKARYAGSPIHYNRKEISYQKQMILVDVRANEEADIRPIPLPIYKAIEVWKCSSYEAALEKCTQNSERDCWVYLEIKTDSFIREDQIKTLKSLKEDILSITPVMEAKEVEEQDVAYQELSFEEMFKAFYYDSLGVEVSDETLTTLLDIVSAEEDEDETYPTEN